MATSEARALLHDIDLLCESGAGLSAVVGPMCGLVRAYADVASIAFFWLDAAGRPAGFYHDCAPATLKDLFITRFDQLFSGPDEVNMVVLARSDGPSIGRLLDPDERDRFWRSNIQQYLCDPLGHRHTFDIRIEAHGVGRAVCCMWREEGQPFGRDDIERMRPLQRAWRCLFEQERDDARWVAVDRGGELVTDATGERLLAIDPAADLLLMNSHLLDQRVSMTTPPEAPPAFARLLATAAAAQGVAETVLAVPAGRLVARARLARAPGGDGGAMLLISLALQAAYDVICIQHLLGTPLTAMQRRVALYGMLRGERADCIAALGTTSEAMKKHCAAVFAALDVGKWSDLAELGERLAVETA